MIRRALLSVYDKRGLEGLASGLAGLGVELLASGGTAATLEEAGIPVRRVDELTEFPELLDGRVKTLHPRVHAGILARRDREDDMAALDRHGIGPIDLVCVNLYPFDEVAWRKDTREEDAVEMIDVGGPAMLRAAAKNFQHVAALSSPAQYEPVLAELRAAGGLSLSTRRSLAAEAFAHTAGYEASIGQWFGERVRFPERLVLTLEKERGLAYGENPHQEAAYYYERGVRSHLLSRVEQLSGRELSFNNLNDLSAARSLAEEFELPACVIVKHANPCGCALAGSIEDAYERALASDPVSAYGGVVVLNRPLGAQLAERLADQFVEVLLAPGYDDRALALLREKPAIRILLNGERRLSESGWRDYKRVSGGFLVQDADRDVDEREAMTVVTRAQPDERAWGDLLLAWRVVKHVTSNAIVIATDLATIGVGSGQMSRVDAVRIAIEKAREHGHDLQGAALASDAFFPFADGPQLALDAGVTTIAQPGGSKRDAEVIEAVDAAGAAMVITGRRHFRH
jgi:phosphoribosylaminoimidazolecarboxamide formyltransferase / IMP cyclohydrolase